MAREMSGLCDDFVVIAPALPELSEKCEDVEPITFGGRFRTQLKVLNEVQDDLSTGKLIQIS